MNDEQAFLMTCRENIGDVTPWLIFADWLEERGDQRAPLLRTLGLPKPALAPVDSVERQIQQSQYPKVKMYGRFVEYEHCRTSFESQDETLLRLAQPSDGLFTIDGMRNFFSQINFSDMAVMFADRESVYLCTTGSGVVWHFVDMRQTMGLIFFLPAVDRLALEIWNKVIEPYRAIVPNNQMIIEMPDNQLWYFHISGKIKKWNVTRD